MSFALAAAEDFLKQLGQIINGLPHFQSHQSESRSVVEQDDENHAPHHIREQHGLSFALVEQRVEVGFADELRQLIVRAEIRGGQRRECRRVEVRLLADRRDELSAAIDQERAASVAIVQESL